MASFDDHPGFFDPERRPEGDEQPFSRWRRRQAEAEALLACTPADDGRRSETDPRS